MFREANFAGNRTAEVGCWIRKIQLWQICPGEQLFRACTSMFFQSVTHPGWVVTVASQGGQRIKCQMVVKTAGVVEYRVQ